MNFGTLAGGLGCFPFEHGAYPPRSDSHTYVTGIRILVRFSTSFEALVHQVIYLPYESYEASPKAISERTSYHGVWLAFHPYPQLIQTVFNLYWFGPPYGFTHTSPWPRIAHPASRLFPMTKSPYSDSLSLRLRLLDLTLPRRITSRLILQKARRHLPKETSTACRYMVSGSISRP